MSNKTYTIVGYSSDYGRLEYLKVYGVYSTKTEAEKFFDILDLRFGDCYLIESPLIDEPPSELKEFFEKGLSDHEIIEEIKEYIKKSRLKCALTTHLEVQANKLKKKQELHLAALKIIEKYIYDLVIEIMPAKLKKNEMQKKVEKYIVENFSIEKYNTDLLIEQSLEYLYKGYIFEEEDIKID
jgi:hypothetical protein